MSNQHTVTINGVHYDPHSGLKVTAPEAAAKRAESVASMTRTVAGHAGSIHASTARSQTLNRAFVQKPATNRPISDMKPVGRPVQHQRSPHITKFAPKQAAAPVPQAHQTKAAQDIKAVAHASVQKAQHHAENRAHAQHAPVKHTPAQVKKDQAINTAMKNAAPASTKSAPKKQKRGRLMSVATAALAVLLLAGYFTYLNMPVLSVKLAASQAGIAATYPQYRPSGYSLNGPVAFQSGQVTMNFAANAGPQKFALSQTKSSWDSSALLTNYVDPKSNSEYATYNDSGLTIYTYGNNAAWMNDGILHTIEGSAPLSNDQVLSIATSM